MAKETFVLVHGAWLGKFCWDGVKAKLENLGHEVITPELPAHGDDRTPANEASLDGYKQTVIDAIGDRENVILVGHSLAGIVISAIAESVPEKLQKLVYLCAYLPRDGESLYALAQEDKNSKTGQFWTQEHPEQYSPATIKPEGIAEVFCADAPPEIQQMLIAKHRPEPVPPMATPVNLSAENFGSVPRFYIETLRDNCVSNQLQKLMLSRTAVEKTFAIDSSHSPFFSMPEQVVKYLNEIAES